MVLEAIRYTSGDLQILDQLQLPYIEVFEPIHDAAQAWHAIRDMRVRGAPAIAIVAALGLAVQLSRSSKKFETASLAKTTIEDNLNYLMTSRPTAVNLADAVGKLKTIVLQESKREDATGTSIKEVYIKAAESMLKEDIEDNKAIGKLGAAWIVAQSGLIDRKEMKESEKKLSVLTHCNTGSLATAGYGTALGIVRSLHESTHLLRAYCTETRPYNQGARLTAYELVHDQIPATLITDSMAASLLSSRKESDRLLAVVVGADRVAANGDTANKIGTLALAVIARQYGVKFVVAAPRTTIDRTTKRGADIVVEERAASEVTCIKGQVLGEQRVETVETAAKGIDVWNPAFDITPAELIDAVVTEVGVVEKVDGQPFQFDDIFKKGRTS